MKNIILIGFMGTGKSAVSKELSSILNIPQIDTDKEIEKLENKTISEIFKTNGEEYFRDLETKFLENLQSDSSFILSCGGGMPIRKQNQTLLKSKGQVFLLTANEHTILNRVQNDADRPLLADNMNLNYIKKMINSRKVHYLNTANFIIKTDDKTVSEICDEIQRLI